MSSNNYSSPQIILSDKPTPETFIFPITFENPEYGIRIVSLPKGYDTPDTVYDLVKNILVLGEPDSIRIEEFTCNNPIQPVYYSAFVYFVNFYRFNTVESVTQAIQRLPYNKTLKLFVPYTDFYWYNGKKMLHLSLQKIEVMNHIISLINPTNPNPSSIMVLENNNNIPLPILPLGESDWTSLHIPIIPNDICIEGIPFKASDFEDFIENKLQLGKIRRIDYVERDDVVKTADGKIEHITRGDVVPGSSPITAIFIHMQHWYDTPVTKELRNYLNDNGQYQITGYCNKATNMMSYFTNNSFKRPYFVLKVNYRPIPDADGKLNIHQLTAMNTKLEKELEELKINSKKALEDMYELLEEVIKEKKNIKDLQVVDS